MDYFQQQMQYQMHMQMQMQMQNEENIRRQEYIHRCRRFVHSYLKQKKLAKPDVLLWSDNRIMEFVQANFEFFHNTNHPDVILALPKCSDDINVLKKHLLPF